MVNPLQSRSDHHAETLTTARADYDRRAWKDAYRRFVQIDKTNPLDADDLERLAVASFLAGHDRDYLQTLERAHHSHLRGGNVSRAARAAFWVGLRLALQGETGPATGWFGRAERLLEGKACAEAGYLLLPTAEQQLAAGTPESAYDTASRAAEIGDRFEDPDLSTCARHIQGRALVQQSEVEKGLALLDEAMVAVIAGELSPIMTGLVYCSVIDGCQQVHAVDRAREWTNALAEWCAGQPQLVNFTRTCLIHRAEILQMSGAWPEAIEEARRACESPDARHEPALGAAFYQQGEIHRLRGAFAEAEKNYRDASRHGCDPLPGLALLRLAQGRTKMAGGAIGRAFGTTPDPLRRMKLLPAYVEIMIASGDIAAARDAKRELEENAARLQTDVTRAMAAHASGAVALASEEFDDALRHLRLASELWLGVGAPYLAARTRELIARSCQGVGDEEGASLEFAAARETFESLGAAPDVARLDAAPAAPSTSSGLSPRELQVLRLVAAGKSNKVIASELTLSEKTVDRHISNIFNKLDVSSRTAAAAWAFHHRLV